MKTAMQELIDELRSLAFTECHISMGAIMLTQGHIDEYGADSSQAAVEVYGDFPSAGDDQFISSSIVDEGTLT